MPSVGLVIGALHSNRAPPGGCLPELRSPSPAWDLGTLSVGVPQGRNRKVTSYLSVLCDSVAAGPAESELGILSIWREGKKMLGPGLGTGCEIGANL